MKKISFWASRHQKLAIGLLIILKIALGIIAVELGKIAFNSGFVATSFSMCLIGILGFLIYYFYPKNARYSFRKSFEFSLIIIGFGALFFIGNAGTVIETNGFFNQAIAANSIGEKPTAESILLDLKLNPEKVLTKAEKRILKTELKKQFKLYVKYKKAGNQKESSDAWKYILLIVGAIGAGILVTVLSCNLACNNNDAAAIIVAVLGAAAIIYGIVAITKNIRRRRAEINQENKSAPASN